MHVEFKIASDSLLEGFLWKQARPLLSAKLSSVVSRASSEVASQISNHNQKLLAISHSKQVSFLVTHQVFAWSRDTALSSYKFAFELGYSILRLGVFTSPVCLNSLRNKSFCSVLPYSSSSLNPLHSRLYSSPSPVMASSTLEAPAPAANPTSPVDLSTIPISPDGESSNGEKAAPSGDEPITVFHDPDNFNVKHPLMHKWTLWFTKPPSGKVSVNERCIIRRAADF